MRIPRLVVHELSSRRAGPFSFQLGAGECLVVMGKSGSGKTVLLRLLADLDASSSGTVVLDGTSRASWPAPAWRRKVVYQAAEPAWWAPVVRMHFDGCDLARVELMLAAVGLPPSMLDAEVIHLSTGERQRLALLRSLARNPSVLLLDEPTAALDRETTLAYEDLVRQQLQQGMAAIWVTHSHEQATRVAHRQLEMANRSLEGQ
ncbi:MAG: ATP-binding cassette domain-containing protein [Proteobacteria bacterium]|nr:ATP-binding cassette domain-containing protein [Pseudomonadota bacterium]